MKDPQLSPSRRTLNNYAIFYAKPSRKTLNKFGKPSRTLIIQKDPKPCDLHMVSDLENTDFFELTRKPLADHSNSIISTVFSNPVFLSVLDIV